MKYVFDEFGNKYEGMDKNEILQSIGAGGERTCVFTGCITYNNEEINFNYTGTLPSATVIAKLLSVGIDPTTNKLTEAEVTSYLELANFSIHFYYLDNEIYVTNANKSCLSFIKIGVGTYEIYPRKSNIEYYVKSTKEINNIKHVTQQEYDSIVKEEDVIYIITDAPLAVENATNAVLNSDGTYSGLTRDSNGILKLGNLIIPQKQLISSTTKSGTSVEFSTTANTTDKYEITFDLLRRETIEVTVGDSVLLERLPDIGSTEKYYISIQASTTNIKVEFYRYANETRESETGSVYKVYRIIQ